MVAPASLTLRVGVRPFHECASVVSSEMAAGASFFSDRWPINSWNLAASSLFRIRIVASRASPFHARAGGRHLSPVDCASPLAPG
jgi:hypothetical protein